MYLLRSHIIFINHFVNESVINKIMFVSFYILLEYPLNNTPLAAAKIVQLLIICTIIYKNITSF